MTTSNLTDQSIVTVRAGVTEPIVFKLKALVNGSWVAANLTTLGVVSAVLHRKPKVGTVDSFSTVDDPTKLAITDPANGEITFSPAASDIVATALNYQCYIRTTDGDDDVADYPHNSNFLIVVLEEFA